jgi:nucleoid DNA-binding protein
MEELAVRVQATLSLATKKEAELLVNIFVSCLEDTLVQHLDEDGFYFKLNGFGTCARSLQERVTAMR